MTEYKVRFEVFEGPLDLLLYLVKKAEVDIYQVDLTKLAAEFLEYIELMRELDLDVAGEFLVMAATLMYIKSRELLPRDQRVIDDEAPVEEDPRWELIRRLVEYKKFKDAALRLQELEFRQEQTYARLPRVSVVERGPVRTEVSIFDLLAGVNTVLKRLKEKESVPEVTADRWTVSEKIQFLRGILAERGKAVFLELFGDSVTRAEVVVTFLALLELIRLGVVRAIQMEPFGEIELEFVRQEEAEARPLARGESGVDGEDVGAGGNAGNGSVREQST
ncbi:MAG: segregation/condensation protein A, partial [Verrucomicrobiae bacterium]|nr:segregation/condensation protein A [Verrucomicrobiae bacterium]